MARTDAQRIAASGRTLEEHRDIVRSLETDPRGSRSVRLDFESGDFAGWSVRRLAKDYSAVIQSEIVRTGTKACRFEIRPGDHVSQGLRAELRDWYNAPFEEDTWYGFSTYLPEDFAPPQGVGVVLAQWHDQAELGDPSGKPPLAIRYLDGALRFTGAFSEVASPESGQTVCFPRDLGRRARRRGSISSSGFTGRGREIPASTPFSAAKDCSASTGRLATATR